MKYILSSILIAFVCFSTSLSANSIEKISPDKTEYKSKSVKELFVSFYKSTGVHAFLNPQNGLKSHGKELSSFTQTWGRVIMILVAFLLFYLAIVKGFEPLLLLPIGFGGLLANIPIADIAGPNGFLGIIYNAGIANGLFPLIIFMGVGAMTDFGPLLANPKNSTSWRSCSIWNIYNFSWRTCTISIYRFFKFFITRLCCDRNYWGSRWTYCDIYSIKACTRSFGRHSSCGILLHGTCSNNSTSNHESFNYKRRAKNKDETAKSCL